MQFGPYLAPPLLKGYLAEKGMKIAIMDLNIEFYDWLLSPDTILAMEPRLHDHLTHVNLTVSEVAKIAKAILAIQYVAENIPRAKEILRTAELYVDTSKRDWAKQVIGQSLNVYEASYDRFRLSLNQIHFGSCGLIPDKVLSFAQSDDHNIVRLFYQQHVRPMISKPHDFIGFSLPAWEQLVPSMTLAQGLREDLGEQVHLCMGGNYITRLVGTWKDQHAFTNLIDSFSVFEGEESLYQLLLALEQSAPLDGVPNLVYSKEGKLKRNAVETLDVNSIPTPAFDGLPLKKYFAPETILPTYTSRSCPYKCAFCTIPYASSKFRARTFDRIVDDIERNAKKYGTRMFTFVDETLTVDSLNGVSQELSSRGLDIRWYGETRFTHRFDDSLAQQLFASGCRKLQFGLESYNQRVLNRMKKGTKIENVLPIIESCLKAGVAVHLFTFLGFPGETEQEAKRTCDFSKWILQLSTEAYGNPYSTVGIGAFGLEVYSDVYYHPERYEVTIENNLQVLNGDEMFELEYHTKSGINHDRALELVREFQNRHIVEEAYEKARHINWVGLSEKETNEEEAFFLYCYAEFGLFNRAQLPDSAPPIQQVKTGESAVISMKLENDVVVHQFEREFLSTEAANQSSAVPVIVFYKPSSDVVLKVPQEMGKTILELSNRHISTKSLEPELFASINALLRHRMLIPQRIPSYIPGSAVVNCSQPLYLEVNPDYVLYRRKSGEFIAFNLVTQEFVVTNGTVALLISVVTHEESDMTACIKLVSTQTGQNEQAIREATERLVHIGVLLACEAV